MTKLDEKLNKDSDLPCEVAATQRIHRGEGEGVRGRGGQGLGLRLNRANFKTTVPPLLEILFHAATVCRALYYYLLNSGWPIYMGN
jgi:hypothetical protein